MRTNSITRLLALTLVLILSLPLSALAESCALCGGEFSGDTYLCADCLLSLLAEKDVAGGLEISGTMVNEDGSVTLYWNDAADNGPYTVYYELLERAPVPFGWTAETGIRGNAVVLRQLAPGVSYVFTVEDASGSKAEAVYYAPDVELGNEIGAKIRVETKMRSGRNHLNRDLTVADIRRPDGREYGFSLKLSYSMLRKTRNYAFTLTVEAPNGYVDVVYSGHMTLNYGKSEVPAWNFVSLEDYFSCLDRYYGGVPTGEYIVSLNFDGSPACTTTFAINE